MSSGLTSARWAALRTFLAVAAPLQSIFDWHSSTHFYINEQAVKILHNDGLSGKASFLKKNLDYIQHGAKWADRGWKNFTHYFHPQKKCGLPFWPDAPSECGRYFAAAKRYWDKGDTTRSLFYLGAAAHLVQDLCVPFHAGAITFGGHQQYERWAEANFHRFTVMHHGLYHLAGEAPGWARANAATSINYLPMLMEKPSIEKYYLVTSVMLPLAQRTTAGFFSFFLQNAGCINCQRKI